MRKITLQELSSGMKLARSIHTPDGRILAAAGTVATTNLINRLPDLGLHSLYIETGTTTEDLLSEKTYLFLLRKFYELETSIQNGKDGAFDLIKEPLFAMLDEVSAGNNILYFDSFHRPLGTELSGHSINVAVLSTVIGLVLGYNALRLKELAIGALLHDIGRLRLPPELWKRVPQTTQERATMEEHPGLSFQMLRGRSDITAVAANIAYQHHERLDGKGYPRGLSGEKIIEAAKIVAVANIFDAMTSESPQRPALSPGKAMNYLRSNAGSLFDVMAVAALVKRVAEYPIGVKVRLSNGKIAEVTRLNKEDARRPYVAYEQSGPEVDLLARPEIHIVEDIGA